MDQIKIGRFIAARRKEVGLTQLELAEKLNISDRAISKWETGKSLPDASIMIELCEILGIGINELFYGEMINMNENDKKYDEIILAMKKEQEETAKRMLALEYVIGFGASITFLVLVFIASFIEMVDWLRVLLILIGFVQFAIAIPFAIRIEQTAGYYECNNCHHKYVPTFSSVLWSMHFGRTRYMKCPECGKKSWQRKVISKE
ncbi:MAG: helix-turn-helix domain-containing protein [Clostridia bacterium]|nr:helix-turn-helix domain-containing protein [Clostridia bacterium]